MQEESLPSDSTPSSLRRPTEAGGGIVSVNSGRPEHIPASVALTLILLLPALFLFGLGNYPLADTNEGLYAEIAREMDQSGQWVIPHLLGVPYIEKPPLWYWLTAAWFHLFGVSAASARLTSGLAMALLTASTGLFLHSIGRRLAGVVAVFLMAACWPAQLLARTAIIDPLFIALLSATLLLYLSWYLRRATTSLLVAALLLGLATLTKGLVAPVLAVGVVGTFHLLVRQWPRWPKQATALACTVYLAVVAPWHVAAVAEQPGFAWFYFINEHVLRFFGLREPHDYHTGPVSFYLPFVPALLLPWTPLLALLARPATATVPEQQPLVRFFQAWTLFPLLFFSASIAKAPYYAFVVVPPLLMWLAVVLEQRLRAPATRLTAYCIAAALGANILGLSAIGHADLSDWKSTSALAVLAIGGLIACVAARLCVPALHGSLRQRIFVLAVAGALSLPIALLAVNVLDMRALEKSSRPLAEVLLHETLPGTPVFAYRDFEDRFASLPLYLQRKIVIIDSVSRDLQFGCRAQGAAPIACISGTEFARHVHGPVAVVVDQERLGEFRRHFQQFQWRARRVGDRWLLISTGKDHGAVLPRP